MASSNGSCNGEHYKDQKFRKPVKNQRNQNKPSVKGTAKWQMVSLLRSRNGGYQIDYGLHGNLEHCRSRQPKTNPPLKSQHSPDSEKSKIKNPAVLAKLKASVGVLAICQPKRRQHKGVTFRR